MIDEHDDDLEHQVDTSDLVYDARAVRRPAGAGELVQRLYGLLYDHPEGLTVDQIHAELATQAWMETDTYRAYAKHLDAVRRNRSSDGKRGDLPQRLAPPRLEYGTPEFKRRAQRWDILRALNDHKKGRGCFRHDGDRWYRGEQAPRVANIPRGVPLTRTVELDVEAQRAAHARETQALVAREQMKARLLEDLTNARSRRKEDLLETIRATFEYLSGR